MRHCKAGRHQRWNADVDPDSHDGVSIMTAVGQSTDIAIICHGAGVEGVSTIDDLFQRCKTHRFTSDIALTLALLAYIHASNRLEATWRRCARKCEG